MPAYQESLLDIFCLDIRIRRDEDEEKESIYQRPRTLGFVERMMVLESDSEM